jgi:peroxiredoxin
MRIRALSLPIAAVIIAALCVYKLTRDYDPPPLSAPVVRRPVPRPLFELLDAKQPSELVRLQSFLGRHRIIVVFFDSRLGADRDPRLLRLYRDAGRIENVGIIVLAVSEALPSENRQAVKRARQSGLRIPFPLLSDPPSTSAAPGMGYLVHSAWGRYDEQARQPLPGIFLIDRAGTVNWNGNKPQPVGLDDRRLERFIAGR